MIYQLSVPAAVPSVQEIRILEWHKVPGEQTEPGDVIVEFETHKAVIEIRAAQPGVLREILAAAGDWRKVGVAVAYFSSLPDEELSVGSEGTSPMSVEFEVT